MPIPYNNSEFTVLFEDSSLIEYTMETEEIDKEFNQAIIKFESEMTPTFAKSIKTTQRAQHQSFHLFF